MHLKVWMKNHNHEKRRLKKKPFYFLLWLHHHSCKHNRHTSYKTNKNIKIQEHVNFLNWAKKHVY